MIELYYKYIGRLIEPGAKVLDLGCGDGALLEYLFTKHEAKGSGIEIDFDKVIDCVKRGISVFQGNLDEGLKEYQTQSFDVVILSQTLQQVQKPLFVISEMLRVGKKGIVTFPNFGHWEIRRQLLLSGKAPSTSNLPYEWYNSPNIRVLTIKDFKIACQKENITILKEIPLYKNILSRFLFGSKYSNLMADNGLFLIKKEGDT